MKELYIIIIIIMNFVKVKFSISKLGKIINSIINIYMKIKKYVKLNRFIRSIYLI